MAIFYTDDKDAKIVTDAIRQRGGTSSPLTYPQGWANAILAIPSSGATVTVTQNETGQTLTIRT